MTPIELAKLFHDTYEHLATEYHYKTSIETRIFNSQSPNGKLMIAVCEEVLQRIHNEQTKIQ